MRRRQLGLALREVREQAKLTMDTLGARLDLSRSAIGAFESGRNLPSQPVLEAILRECRALDRFDLLNELRKEAKKPGWWSTHRLPPWLKAYVGLETDAIGCRVFGLELVPGLLQTESYMRRLHSIGKLSEDEIDRRVTARQQRQQRLVGSNQIAFSAVVSEAALNRLLAAPDLALPQLRHLASSAQLPSVSLRILPFSVGLHRSMSGSFTLLEFAPGVSPQIGYQEYAVGAHLVDDPKDVLELGHVYDELHAEALDERESLGLISGLIVIERGDMSG